MTLKRKYTKKDSVVLVCILKDKRDLDILKKEHWYRIPVSHAPVTHFDYLAFYEPLSNPPGKYIRYYSKIKSYKTLKRYQLLPEERNHPNAKDSYLKINVGNIMRLKSPIKNSAPRRVSFGFTTLSKLKKARNILEVYDVFPLEQIIGENLQKIGIKAIPQCWVSVPPYAKATEGKKTKPKNKRRKTTPRGKRFRLDFAIYCKEGKIAIECDNQKAHSVATQKIKDKQKNALLKKDGWHVLRIQESEILKNPEVPIRRIGKTIQKLGGQDK